MFGTLRRESVPLLCPAGIADAIEGQLEFFTRDRIPEIRPLYRTSMDVGKVYVEWFRVPHDAPGGCYGFVVHAPGNGQTLSLATDIGTIEQSLPGFLAEAHMVIVESNHDLGMLMNSDRPAWLKQRIRERGHISNDECGGLLRTTLRTPGSRVRRIILAHLSQECNTEPLAVGSARAALKEIGREDLPVSASHADRPTRVFEV
jgi:phosphoribosyl 1,2-cyclic phosphodiesterase